MLSVIYFGIWCFNLIGLRVVANPIETAGSAIVDRELDLDWPALLGEGNKPQLDHLTKVYKAITAGAVPGAVASDDQTEALRQIVAKWKDLSDSSSFWATLIAVTKANPDGDWVKLMFDAAEPEGGQDGQGVVNVVLYKRESDTDPLTPEHRPIEIGGLSLKTNGDKYTGPLWPLVIGQAVRDSGWDPAEDNIEAILELLTGYKVKTTKQPDIEQTWELFSKAQVRPVIFRLAPNPALMQYRASGSDEEYRTVMETISDGEQKSVKWGSIWTSNWDMVRPFPQDFGPVSPNMSDPNGAPSTNTWKLPDTITMIDDPNFTHFEGKRPEG